jgi:branched-chain polyamine synthase A-like protein
MSQAQVLARLLRGDDPHADLPSADAIASAAATILARHGCERPEPGADDEADVRHALYWLVRMAERTYRRLFDPPPAPDAELAARFEALLAERPERDAEHAQLHVDAASSLRRAEIVRGFVARYPGPVLAVGDDDAVTLALALLGVPELHAVDIDERVLGFVAAAARSIGARVEVAKADVLGEPVPPPLRKRCAAVITDPIRSLEPTLAFVLFGAAAMRRDAPSRLFFCDHPEWSFEHALAVEALAGAGLHIVETHEDVHAYPLDAGAIDTDRMARELDLDPAWLRELASSTSAWSNLYVLSRDSLADSSAPDGSPPGASRH